MDYLVEVPFVALKFTGAYMSLPRTFIWKVLDNQMCKQTSH
jgi:hypothetical protein